MAALEVHELRKGFSTARGRIEVLHSVSFRVADGEWLSCLGPSGCGKTTLLRIVAGLLEPDAGTVSVLGALEDRLGQCAYLPQEDTLFPWRTALGNALLPAEIDGRSREDARVEALALFGRFGLSGFEHLHPVQLSGGMRQRVELARTFLSRRSVLLMDEPLGALDPFTRAGLQTWLLEMWTELRRTVLWVTHDVEEALVLSDRLLLFTPRPASVREEVSLANLGRPRRREDSEVVALRARLLGLLAQEVAA